MEIAKTIKVSLTISSRFGQVTFVSSALTSERKVMIFFTRVYCSKEITQKKGLDLHGFAIIILL